MFNKYDLSGDGELDFKEFAVIFSQNEGANGQQQDTGPNRGNADPYIQEKSRQEMVNNEMRHDSPQALLKLFQDKLRSRGARGMVGL